MSTNINAEQLALWPYVGHRNHYLFSDYYLNIRLPTLQIWQKPSGLPTTFTKLKNLWSSVRDTIDSTKEPQTREYLINPILHILGHFYEPEPSLPTNHTVKAPDYAIFAERNSMRRAAAKRGSLEYFKQTIAVAEAKRYGRPMDQKSREGADPFDNNNPSFQIDYYIRTTGLRWGILTDGRYWRLYNRETSFKLNSYYEVDLGTLVEQNNETAFKYFYLFFRREAFLGVERQESFLDHVFEQSAHYALAIGSKLQDAVYEALETLCEGFVALNQNHLDPQLQLKDIYDNSLILLYRLLFILHAESRGLLPLDTNKSYRDNYSLDHLKKDIAQRIDQGEVIPTDWTNYWAQLKSLFNAINESSRDIDVYEYNGGLFETARHPFLEQYVIGDFYLARVIDLLARAESEEEKRRDFVDYRDLAIQHLGSIYEGLLQHQPRVANEEMAIIKEGGKEKTIPQTEVKGKRVFGQKHQGEIYLALEKGERKYTGSYYTPEYIVQYIVENTLGPLIGEKIEEWRQKVIELETKVKNSRGENRAILKKELDNAKNSLAEKIMGVNLLDPAMGSGHFLVRATERLAEELATNPYMPLPTHDGDIEDVDYWKRRVVERCIYGVDLNPLAVELAKVSLWLSTVAKDKPLSFLDHHLRCGNSLIGARLEELEKLPRNRTEKTVPSEQLTLFDKKVFTKDIALSVGDLAIIDSLSSDTLDDIKEKDRLLREIVDVRRLRYKRLANLWVSYYFGNEMDEHLYNNLALLVQGKDNQLTRDQAETYLEKADLLAQERRFFHWELEFPELFFDRNGQGLTDAGFDAVVGNPPWGSNLSRLEKEYLRMMDTDTQIPNSYIYFIARSLDILKPGCYHSFVVPDSLLTKEYPKTRERFVKQCTVKDIVFIRNTGLPAEVRPFPEVNHDIVVYVVSSGSRMQSSVIVRFVDPPVSDISALPLSAQIPQMYLNEAELDFRFNLLLNEERLKVRNKIENLSLSLSQLCESHEGIHTGNIRHKLFFYQDDVKPVSSHLKRLVIGSSHGDLVGRYILDWAGSFVNYDSSVISSENGEYASLREERIFLEPKLFVVRTGDDFFVVSDREQFYASNNLFCMLKKHNASNHYLLEYIEAILNSRFAQSYSRTYIAPRLGHLYTETKIKHLDIIPIRRINFTTPKAERVQLIEESKKLYQQYIQTNDWGKLLLFVDQRLPQNPDGSPNIDNEQSDVVHDLLAFLAEEMTRLHKEKQAEIKAFLTWLENYLGINLVSLKNKTKIKDYWKANVAWKGFLDALNQNRKAIESSSGINITRRESQETLSAEFNSSVAKMKPIVVRIEQTDRLIDKIVYRLYGLTEEEIQIVQSKDKPDVTL